MPLTCAGDAASLVGCGSLRQPCGGWQPGKEPPDVPVISYFCKRGQHVECQRRGGAERGCSCTCHAEPVPAPGPPPAA